MEKTKNFIFSLDVIIVALMFICQIIDYFFYISRGIFTLIPLFFIWLFVVSLNKKNLVILNNRLFSIRNQLLFLIIFIVGVFFNYIFLIQSSLAIGQLLIFVQYIPIIIISSYYSDQSNYRQKNTILLILILALGIQAFISIPFILNSDPTFIRYLSNGDLRTDEMSELARKNGVGTNSLYSSLASIIILAFTEYSTKGKYSQPVKLIIYGCLVGLIVTVLLSTFAASILLLLLGILFYFIFRFIFEKKRLKYIFSFLILGVGFYFLFNIYLINSDWFQPILFKIQLYQESDGGDVTGRDKLALVSFNSFINSPFFGIGVPEKNSYNLIGGHLPWIDNLASYGIVVFGVFLLFLINRIKNVKNIFKNKDIYSYQRLSCAIGVLLFVISNFISPMLYVPISYIFFYFFYTSFPVNYENNNTKSRNPSN